MGKRDEISAKIENRYFILQEDGEEIPIDINSLNQQEQISQDFPELVKLINFEVLGKKRIIRNLWFYA